MRQDILEDGTIRQAVERSGAPPFEALSAIFRGIGSLPQSSQGVIAGINPAMFDIKAELPGIASACVAAGVFSFDAEGLHLPEPLWSREAWKKSENNKRISVYRKKKRRERAARGYFPKGQLHQSHSGSRGSRQLGAIGEHAVWLKSGKNGWYVEMIGSLIRYKDVDRTVTAQIPDGMDPEAIELADVAPKLKQSHRTAAKPLSSEKIPHWKVFDEFEKISVYEKQQDQKWSVTYSKQQSDTHVHHYKSQCHTGPENPIKTPRKEGFSDGCDPRHEASLNNSKCLTTTKESKDSRSSPSQAKATSSEVRAGMRMLLDLMSNCAVDDNGQDAWISLDQLYERYQDKLSSPGCAMSKEDFWKICSHAKRGQQATVRKDQEVLYIKRK